jgi:archaellin
MVNMGSLKNKKAMMGVSTLIIFITAILVSAVAASVIVRTVGILQERAFTVGTEVRNRLVTVLDFISVTSYNNLTLEQAYGLNVLVRTRAGSYAYDLATMGLIFTSDQGSLTARLQHTENEDFGFVLPDINNETYVSIPDMDEDKLSEKVRLVSDGGVGLDQIEFEFFTIG